MIKRNVVRLATLSLLVGLCLALCACSIPQPKPKEGIWYCDELKLEINFSLYSERSQYFVKRYHSDGTYEDVESFFDFGNRITIGTAYDPENRLIFKFLYRNGVFSVTTIDGKHTYIFERIDN